MIFFGHQLEYLPQLLSILVSFKSNIQPDYSVKKLLDQNEQDYCRDSDTIADDEQDEMILTRTDAGCAISSSNAESTYRSNQGGIPGEFEKRITDIKAKLNQIKNSINTELDNKPKSDAQGR
jgi:hypothetical protein